MKSFSQHFDHTLAGREIFPELGDRQWLIDGVEIRRCPADGMGKQKRKYCDEAYRQVFIHANIILNHDDCDAYHPVSRCDIRKAVIRCH